MIAALHFAKGAFALHFLFERFQRLVDVVVANDDLNDNASPHRPIGRSLKRAHERAGLPKTRAFVH